MLLVVRPMIVFTLKGQKYEESIDLFPTALQSTDSAEEKETEQNRQQKLENSFRPTKTIYFPISSVVVVFVSLRLRHLRSIS